MTLLLVALGVVSMLAALDQLSNMGKIRSGVHVADIELGGLTEVEARTKLGRAASNVSELELRVEGEPVAMVEPLGASVDLDQTIEEASSLGRSGGPFRQIKDRLSLVSGIRVEPVTSLDRSSIQENLERLADSADSRATDASVTVEDDRVRVVPSRAGYKVDERATLQRIEQTVGALESRVEVVGESIPPAVKTAEAEEVAGTMRSAAEGGLEIANGEETWQVSPEQALDSLRTSTHDGEFSVHFDRDAMRAELADIYESVEEKPREASYRFESGDISVVPGNVGREISREEFMDAIEKDLLTGGDGSATVTVPMRRTEPEITTEEAERLKPTTVLGEYKTDYTWDEDPGRRYNMDLASQALTGAVAAPGEVFSFNAITEPLEYEQAKVIENGAVDYAEGGGLSQVSSTLYMAANYAGLEIVEANPHYAELPYIRPGLDTTVWFGALDLRFRNNTDGYILVEQWQGEDGYNHARIWGKPTGKEVEISSEKVYEGVDASGDPTTRWAATKTTTRNGETLFDGVFRRVAYKELDPYEPRGR